MAANLFKRAAAYRKKHKGMSMPEAVQALSGKSAPVKKAVGKAKPKAKKVGTVKRPKTTRVTETITVRKSKSAPKKSVVGGKVGRAIKLEHKINSLEAKRKAAKTIDLKNVIQREINATHKAIRAIR